MALHVDKLHLLLEVAASKTLPLIVVGVKQHRSGTPPRIGLNSLIH
jgi:hypothetical protein